MHSHFTNLSDAQISQLRNYRDLLIRWNQRFNLTAIDDAEGIDRRLIGDALRMLPAIDDAVARVRSAKNSAPPIRLIDVGTGAGFPGMVLKIARPELSITLLEATGKKVGFIQHVIDELALSEITAMHGRAEEAAHDPAHRARYDLATARAVASLPALIELTMPFLRKGGIGIFPKGAEIADELREGAAAASELGCAIESADALPPADGDLVTRLVIAVKIELTPIRYPRRAGVPVKDPLGRAHR